MIPSHARPVADRLARAADVPGALLLTGTSESALAGEALALAASLLCPGEDPDRRCASCRRVAEGLHPDLFVVAPEGVQIRIDRVREALAFAAGRPYEGPRRVAIVERAAELGAEAANALLKSLEEPGSRFQWILTTTRPEMLLPTIRSRCAVVRVAPPTAADRLAHWRSRGFTDDEAADLDLFETDEKEADAEDLAEFRRWRAAAVEALQSGLSSGELAALILFAESLAKAEPWQSRLFSEILADAAASRSVPLDLLRHRAVAGTISRIAASVPREALERAAFKAVDAPPDSRRGNRRLHFESLLLELFLARG